MMFLGIDIGGTNIKAGLLDSTNRLTQMQSVKTEADEGYSHVLAKLIDLIASYQTKSKLLSIGIGVPGIVSKDGIIKIAPNLPQWIDINLVEDLSRSIELPISLDNDANAAALAELELGAGRNFSDFIYVTLGTGVGGAIVSGRKIFRGAGGAAGEIGHTIIDCNDPSASFGQGTLESKCGKNGILSHARSLLQPNSNSMLAEISDFDVKSISECAEKGDETSLLILKDIGNWLGIGLASAMNLLDIDKVVIGGGISQSHRSLFESALSAVRARALPNISKSAEISIASFGNEAGTIGAALLGKRKFENL